MAPEKVAAEIEAASAKIRANGWPVHIIRLPFPKPGERGAPAPGSPEAQGRLLSRHGRVRPRSQGLGFLSRRKGGNRKEEPGSSRGRIPGPAGQEGLLLLLPAQAQQRLRIARRAGARPRPPRRRRHTRQQGLPHSPGRAIGVDGRIPSSCRARCRKANPSSRSDCISPTGSASAPIREYST